MEVKRDKQQHYSIGQYCL